MVGALPKIRSVLQGNYIREGRCLHCSGKTGSTSGRRLASGKEAGQDLGVQHPQLHQDLGVQHPQFHQNCPNTLNPDFRTFLPNQCPHLSSSYPVSGEFDCRRNSAHLEDVALSLVCKNLSSVAISDRNFFREDRELWSFRLHLSQKYEVLNSSFFFPHSVQCGYKQTASLIVISLTKMFCIKYM